jgi:hypothetical protein
MKRTQLRLPPGVLKIKKGYNPNSSSIGTVLYSFPVAWIVLNTIIALCAGLILGKKKGKNIK